MSSLSIDGHSLKVSTTSGTSTLAGTSITMAHPNDLVIVVFSCETTASPHQTVTSISKSAGTATVGTFTKRQSIYLDNAGTAWSTLEVWSAPATIAGTLTITVNTSGAYDCGCVETFAVNYDSVNIPVWTADGPFTGSSSTSSSLPNTAGIATAASSLIFGFTGYPDNQATQANSAGYTQLDGNGTGAGNLGDSLWCEYQAFATPQSGLTVSFKDAWPEWIMIADAVENPSTQKLFVPFQNPIIFFPGLGPGKGLNPLQAYIAASSNVTTVNITGVSDTSVAGVLTISISGFGFSGGSGSSGGGNLSGGDTDTISGVSDTSYASNDTSLFEIISPTIIGSYEISSAGLLFAAISNFNFSGVLDSSSSGSLLTSINPTITGNFNTLSLGSLSDILNSLITGGLDTSTVSGFGLQGGPSFSGGFGNLSVGSLFDLLNVFPLGNQSNSVGTSLFVNINPTIAGIQSNTVVGGEFITIGPTITGVWVNSIAGTISFGNTGSGSAGGNQSNTIAGSGFITAIPTITGIQANTIAGTEFITNNPIMNGIQSNTVVGGEFITIGPTITGIQANTIAGTEFITIIPIISGVSDTSTGANLFATVSNFQFQGVSTTTSLGSLIEVLTILGLNGSSIQSIINQLFGADSNFNFSGIFGQSGAGILQGQLPIIIGGVGLTGIGSLTDSTLFQLLSTSQTSGISSFVPGISSSVSVQSATQAGSGFGFPLYFSSVQVTTEIGNIQLTLVSTSVLPATIIVTPVYYGNETLYYNFLLNTLLYLNGIDGNNLNINNPIILRPRLILDGS